MGFHNGVFAGGHQHLGFHFPLNVGRGCRAVTGQGFPTPASKPRVVPMADKRWQQKHMSESSPGPRLRAAVTKGTLCSSVALIPGSRNETSSHRKASLRTLPSGYFTPLGGCGSWRAWSKSRLGDVWDLPTHMKEPILKSLQSPRDIKWQRITGSQGVLSFCHHVGEHPHGHAPRVKDAAELDTARCLSLLSRALSPVILSLQLL